MVSAYFVVFATFLISLFFDRMKLYCTFLFYVTIGTTIKNLIICQNRDFFVYCLCC